MKSQTTSDKEFQKSTEVGRTYLRLVLEELVKNGYVRKEWHGREAHYSISSQYCSYFSRAE